MSDQPVSSPLDDASASIDRRAEPRLPCSLVIVYNVGAEMTCRATVQDISPGGIGLVTAQPFPSGTSLTIQLRVDDQLILSKAMRIRHVRKQGPASWFLGGSFLDRLTKKEMKLFV